MTIQYNTVFQISVNYPLTKNPQARNLKNVPSPQTTRYNFKQTVGGNVTNIQPPFTCGFFMEPTISGDCTLLPGVVNYRKSATGKVHSVPNRTLEGTRQLYCCYYFKQSVEECEMQTAKTLGTATPVATAKGLSPISDSTRCLLHSDVLLNTIIRAKQKRQQDDRANAYAELLEHFHKAILPAFFIECQGNLSETSRLLGIHRETVKTYATLAEIDMSGAGRAGGVA